MVGQRHVPSHMEISTRNNDKMHELKLLQGAMGCFLPQRARQRTKLAATDPQAPAKRLRVACESVSPPPLARGRMRLGCRRRAFDPAAALESSTHAT